MIGKISQNAGSAIIDNPFKSYLRLPFARLQGQRLIGLPLRLAIDTGFSKEYSAFGPIDRKAAGIITLQLQNRIETR